jgi:hypothetical protein
LVASSPTFSLLTLTASRDVNINQSISATNGNLSVCCGRDINLSGAAAITTVNGSVLLSAGRTANINGAMTATDGNIAICAAENINISGAISLTRGSSIPAQSLGLPLGLTLNAGYGATGPGVGGGTVVFAPGTPPIAMTGPNAPATIFYNPVSYAAPTDFLPNFTLVTSTLTQNMLVFASGGDKAFDGTTAALLSGLKGAPAGVTLVAGPGSSATYDSADVGANKVITYNGYSLGGPGAVGYALATNCCGPISARTTGNITPAVIAPALVGAAALTPVITPNGEIAHPSVASDLLWTTPRLALTVVPAEEPSVAAIQETVAAPPPVEAPKPAPLRPRKADRS